MLQDDVADTKLIPKNINEALASLSIADHLRLDKAARYLSRPSRYTPEELINQTLLVVLEGGRPYNPNVDLISFLFMNMKNVASNDCRSQQRHPEISLDAQVQNSGKSLLDKQQNPYPSPEHIVESEENLSIIKKSILDLFKDNLVTQTVVEGIIEEMSPKEIQELTELDSKGYASARRLMRRRIDKAFPKGWTYE